MCKCVLYYCHRVATQLQLTDISYHIISYHIISSYHIVSYRIVSYRIISYRIISYHIISYHIISYIISYHIISYTSDSKEPNGINQLAASNSCIVLRSNAGCSTSHCRTNCAVGWAPQRYLHLQGPAIQVNPPDGSNALLSPKHR